MNTLERFSVNDQCRKTGTLKGYLILPSWKGSFPFDWARDHWPILQTPLFVKRNQITKVGQLRSYANGYNFAYIAGGTGSTTPQYTDTLLETEYQRFPVDDLFFQPGQIDASAVIPPGTGNVTYEEWGVFLDDATSIANTGTLYSHLLQNFTKNLGDHVLLTYTLKEEV
jgi:hypothetical protein